MRDGLRFKTLLVPLLVGLAACSSQSTGSSGPSGGGMPWPSGGGSSGPTSPGPTSPGGVGGGVPSGGSGSGGIPGEGETAAGGASGGSAGGSGSEGEEQGGGESPAEEAGDGGGSEGEGAAVRDLGPDTETFGSVEGCADQDRVARQLREAAEDDPFLRAALWDEYNEYKKLVAR
jgi:hypothetical protein